MTFNLHRMTYPFNNSVREQQAGTVLCESKRLEALKDFGRP
jgi:hypothetical protein